MICIINWNWLEVLKKSLEVIKDEGADTIVLDNGSKDGSHEWLSINGPPKTILLPENRGSSVGRNMLIRESQGDILLLDSDILYIPGSFAYLKKRLSECPPEIGAIGFNPWLCTYDKHIQHLPSPDAPLHMNDSLRFAPTHYGLFRREVFAKCSFDENFGVGWGGEDDDLYRQMRKHGYDVRFIDHVFYHAKGTEKWHNQHSVVANTIPLRRDYLRKKWGR